MQPKIIIGGASKSGTTALYYYLSQHPDICLSAKKELHYFSRPWLEKTINGPGDRFVLAEVPNTFTEYLSYFSYCDRAKIAMDISPSYLFHYRSADEMKKQLDGIRIIFVLRNPAEKAFSQYMHLVGEGREKLDFDDAINKEGIRESAGYSDMWLYRKSGMYSDAIQYFKQTFGESNLRVFYYEEFLNDPEFVLREICEFSGVDDQFNFMPIYNANRSSLPKSALLAKAIAPNAFTYILRRMVPQGVGRGVRKWLKDLNAGENRTLSDSSRAALMSVFAEDIRKVELLVGRKSGWLV